MLGNAFPVLADCDASPAQAQVSPVKAFPQRVACMPAGGMMASGGAQKDAMLAAPAGAHRAWPERQTYTCCPLKDCAPQARHAQVGLTVAGGGQDVALGGAPFHAQALTALGLSGAGASLEVALGGDPPVDSRLLVSWRV